MVEKNLSIDSNNILPIIKKWLYSDKDVFLRELISNSCDAVKKLKILRDQGKVDIADSEFKIEINLDKENKKITISDTGIGMNADEVEKYIAQIAFSGAKDFVEKYQSKEEKDQIIGHFGLGFYSSYMVSDFVELDTLSYKEKAKPALWKCDGSSTYDLSKGTRETRGTTITLNVNEDSLEYLEENKIRAMLLTFCSYLPVPIFLNEEQINKKEPLWLKNPSECTDKEYLEFYRSLHPMDPEPMFWIHLNVDYPFNLQGILYFPKMTKRFDPNQSSIKLFCNRVFVSDQLKDLLPDYLMVLKGAIDSPDIPLNVSRSSLQVDKTVRQLSSHISKKITDKLSSLHKMDKEKFTTIWPDIELVVKLAVLQDDKFYEKAKEFLLFQNANDEWTNVEDYLERNKEKTKDKIFYALKENYQASFLDLYKERGIEVLYVNSYIDTPLINHLESKLSPTTFQRIDGAIDESLLDTSKEKSVLDDSGKSEEANIAKFFKESLSIDNLEVNAKSLASDDIPGFFVIDENQRRMRDYLMMTQGTELPQQGKTFVVNTNNPLVTLTHKLGNKKPDLAKELSKQLYDLTSLSQKELDAKQLSSFVSSSHKLLEKLVSGLAD